MTKIVSDWQHLQNKLKERFETEMDHDAILFMIGLQELDKPRTIPVSKKSMRNLMKLLPAQGVQPDEEVYAEEEENLKGSGIPSDDIELDAMTNLIQTNDEGS